MKLHGSYIAGPSFDDQQRLLRGRDVNVILDVGGNVGNTVALYAEMFSTADIYAFEPYPEAFVQLRTRFASELRIRCEQKAVSSHSGTTAFYVNEYADTNSLLPRPRDTRRYYAADNVPHDVIDVGTVTLDEYTADHNIGHIGILKLDIQGGEGRALEGADRLLRSQQVDLIFSEVLFVPHYEGSLLFHEITSCLARYNYTLYNLYNCTWATNGQLRFADALYISPELRQALDTYPPEP